MEKRTTNLPLAGKRFFIDPKAEKSIKIKIRQGLIQLGGKVEEFLDGNIHFAIISESNTRKVVNSQHRKRADQSPFNTTGVPQSSNVSNRWRDLAKIAGASKASNNIIDTARKLGLKVRPVNEVWQWIAKQTSYSTHTAGLISPGRAEEIKLRGPCLKIEDTKTKPVYDEFEAFSYLDVSLTRNKCPIVNESAPVYKKKQKKKPEKRGFCECCQCSYLNERKHCSTVQHINYGETTSHYGKLDEYIKKNKLDLTCFLNQHESVVPCNVRTETRKDARIEACGKPADTKLDSTLVSCDLIDNSVSEDILKNSPQMDSLKYDTSQEKPGIKRTGIFFENHPCKISETQVVAIEPSIRRTSPRKCVRLQQTKRVDNPKCLQTPEKDSGNFKSNNTGNILKAGLQKHTESRFCETNTNSNKQDIPFLLNTSPITRSKTKLLSSGLKVQKLQLESPTRGQMESNAVTSHFLAPVPKNTKAITIEEGQIQSNLSNRAKFPFVA